jgi:hypothetical protein
LILNEETLGQILLGLSIFISTWPIYREVNRRYWIIAFPYVLTIAEVCLQYDMVWEKFVEAIPESIIILFVPFPFHVAALLVKRFKLEV